jgi:hypothetical protein
MQLNPHLIQELKLKSASDLKASLPLYPVVRRQEEGKSIVFSTLVRKKYDGSYYLIPMKFKGETEAKAIHGLHSNVHQYLMLGVYNFLDVKDDDQTNEVTRLKNIK